MYWAISCLETFAKCLWHGRGGLLMICGHLKLWVFGQELTFIAEYWVARQCLLRSVLIHQIGSVSETDKSNLLISMKTFAVLIVVGIGCCFGKDGIEALSLIVERLDLCWIAASSLDPWTAVQLKGSPASARLKPMIFKKSFKQPLIPPTPSFWKKDIADFHGQI